MSVDPEPVTTNQNGPDWQPVPRDWAPNDTNGAASGGHHTGQGQGQDAGGTPMDRWVSEGKTDAPWDNVGAVKATEGASGRQ